MKLHDCYFQRECNDGYALVAVWKCSVGQKVYHSVFIAIFRRTAMNVELYELECRHRSFQVLVSRSINS